MVEDKEWKSAVARAGERDEDEVWRTREGCELRPLWVLM